MTLNGILALASRYDGLRNYLKYDIETDHEFVYLNGSGNLLTHGAVARIVTQWGLAEAASWVYLRQAIYVFLTCLKSIDMCLDSFRRSDDDNDVERGLWNELEQDIGSWYNDQPPSFEPIYVTDSEPNNGRALPTIWMPAMDPVVAM
ncbi:hypothetical protein F4775DRAFT_594029 [Biscogniauxia sp. FL1348]|nr:hypothetical protein F4775DRAFT_594029 [Biscogniauxia sp. FL1348]